MNNWLYLAASSRADAERTLALAQQKQLIVRTALNVDGNRIANVKHLRIGDRVLLAYRGEDAAIALHGIIQQPDNPHDRAAAIDIICPPESCEIAGNDYPLLERDHLEVIRLRDLHECDIEMDAAAFKMNALHRLEGTELERIVVEELDLAATDAQKDLAQEPEAQVDDSPQTIGREAWEQPHVEPVQQKNDSIQISVGSGTANPKSSKAGTRDPRKPDRLFDQYLFADYSGGGEDAHAQGNIRLYRSTDDGEPERLYRQKLNPNGQSINFSRNALRERVQEELRQATDQGHRVIFGFDHQYSWPLRLLTLAGVDRLPWREAISQLCDGDEITGLPPLDIPRRYCKAFNEYCDDDVLWTPIRRVAATYGIDNNRPNLANDDLRFRLTEQVPALQGNANPKPADAVGGMGEGIVGGQTICGMKQTALMLMADEQQHVAWWPFDGLNITVGQYTNKHVGVEIYPSAIRPANVEQNDDNDAYHSCLHVQAADQEGRLGQLLTLNAPNRADQIMKEGWIVGMDLAQHQNE